MGNIHLTVEASAGSHVQDVAVELIELSKRIGISVDCKFNGVTLLANPDSNPVRLVENWREELKSQSQHKYARG